MGDWILVDVDKNDQVNFITKETDCMMFTTLTNIYGKEIIIGGEPLAQLRLKSKKGEKLPELDPDDNIMNESEEHL